MATTRNRSSQSSASPTPSQDSLKTGQKRAADSDASSSASKKRGRPKKEQKTIEETINVEEKHSNDDDMDIEMKNGSPKDAIEDDTVVAQQINGKGEHKSENDVNGKDEKQPERKVNGKKDENLSEAKNAFDEIKADESEVKKAATEEQEKKTEDINKNNNSVIEDPKREAEVPSSILEKGIIYFFFRSRVNIDDPQGIEDVARSYIVLRPLPLGAKLGDGPLEDTGNARLLALPKKMLPKSTSDRFLVFVEKGEASIKELRDHFSGTEYPTKTQGTSNQQAATPFAEGIYALTSTGRESHLAYQITVPSSIGEIQKELGLHQKGSYVVSAKNPQAPGPANATLDNPAKYPESIQKKFRDLRWMPLEPELLKYEGTQFLLIGEGMGNLGRSVEEQGKDKKDAETVKPEEELEKLEEEDHDRVKHLKEDDPIFADLGLSSKEYPKMQTTW